ncbi:CsgG/HfaB family protein [Spirochaetota bacterium]
MLRKSAMIILCTLIILIPLLSQTKAGKVRIAVMDMVAQEGIAQSDASAISEMLRTEIVKSGTFEVIERGQINQALKEQEFQASGCTDSACAVEIGKILALDRIIVGTVGQLFGKLVLNVRLIDVGSGKILLAEKEQTTKDDIFKTIEVFAGKIADSAAETLLIEVKIKDIESLIRTGNVDDAKKKLDIYKQQKGVNEKTKELDDKIKKALAKQNYKNANSAYNSRLYSKAKEYIDKAINGEPNNMTYLNLSKRINDQLEKEKMRGAAGKKKVVSSRTDTDVSGISIGFDVDFGFSPFSRLFIIKNWTGDYDYSYGSIYTDKQVDWEDTIQGTVGGMNFMIAAYVEFFLAGIRLGRFSGEEFDGEYTYSDDSNLIFFDNSITGTYSGEVEFGYFDFFIGIRGRKKGYLSYSTLYFLLQTMKVEPEEFDFSFTKGTGAYEAYGDSTEYIRGVSGTGYGFGFRSRGVSAPMGGVISLFFPSLFQMAFYPEGGINFKWYNGDTMTSEEYFEGTSTSSMFMFSLNTELGLGFMLNRIGLFFAVTGVFDMYMLNYSFTGSGIDSSSETYTYDVTDSELYMNAGVYIRFGYMFDFQNTSSGMDSGFASGTCGGCF